MVRGVFFAENSIIPSNCQASTAIPRLVRVNRSKKLALFALIYLIRSGPETLLSNKSQSAQIEFALFENRTHRGMTVQCKYVVFRMRYAFATLLLNCCKFCRGVGEACYTLLAFLRNIYSEALLQSLRIFHILLPGLLHKSYSIPASLLSKLIHVFEEAKNLSFFLT